MKENLPLQSVSGAEYARIRQELLDLKAQHAKSVPRTEYDVFVTMLGRVNATFTIEPRPHSLVLCDTTVTVQNMMPGKAGHFSQWVFAETGNLLTIQHTSTEPTPQPGK